MKALIFGVCALAALSVAGPAGAMPLPEAALQLASPDIASTSLTVDFDGTDLTATGTSVSINTGQFLLGSFSVSVLGLMPDLSFTSGALTITDTVLLDGDQSLASINLVAVGTDNMQIQLLFSDLTGPSAPLFQATSPFALVLINNIGAGGSPTFDSAFNDASGNNSDTAAVQTAVPVPGALSLMLGGVAATAFAARRRR